jgi:hypothetical protein
MNQEINPKEQIDSFHLLLPTELKSAMEQKATAEKRSLNAQIVLVLENFVKSAPKTPLKIAA